MILFKCVFYFNLILGTANVLLLIEVIYQIQKESSCSKPQELRYMEPRHKRQRIVGGLPTDVEKCPYITAILGKVEFEEYGYDFLCAAVIVAVSYALTAYHCTDIMLGYSEVKVRSGSTLWRRNGTLHDIIGIFKDENFREDYMSHDLAILLVKPGFDKTSVISVAGKYYKLPDNSLINVTGWGETNVARSNTLYSTPMDRLYTVTLYIINTETCINLINEYLKAEDPEIDDDFILDHTQFCAGTTKGGKNACVYDSGGPAVRNGILVGIVSSGAPVCGTKEYPGVYANLGNVYEWTAEMSEKLNMQVMFN